EARNDDEVEEDDESEVQDVEVVAGNADPRRELHDAEDDPENQESRHGVVREGHARTASRARALASPRRRVNSPARAPRSPGGHARRPAGPAGGSGGGPPGAPRAARDGEGNEAPGPGAGNAAPIPRRGGARREGAAGVSREEENPPLALSRRSQRAVHGDDP